MERHHCLGFWRFAVRGLPLCFQMAGKTGRQRGKRIGSGKPGKQVRFSRLHLTGNTMRFLNLGKPGGCRASRVTRERR